jgi:hypothetical protein
MENGARRTREIESRIATTKAAFSKEKLFSPTNWTQDLRKKLLECSIWRIALRCAGTRALRKLGHKYLEVLKCGVGEGWRSGLHRWCEK